MPASKRYCDLTKCNRLMAHARNVRMVKGPARVRVRGRCTVLGADVSDSLISVNAGKALPFEPGPYCRLHVRGSRARAWWASPAVSGTTIWKDSCSEILSLLERQKSLVVLVVGEGDVGKSTFCTYLANVALTKGIVPCVVDGDIGQGDIAPPTAIGAARIIQPILDLRDIHASHCAFVGAISPAGIESFVTQQLCSLSRPLRDHSRLQIINTDGYVQDGGLLYKRAICNGAQPDVVVLLGGNSALKEAMRPCASHLVKAKASLQARKTWTDRKRRRHHQFLRFVGKGRITVDMTRMSYSYLGHSIPQSYFSSLTRPDIPLMLPGIFVGLELNGQVNGFGVIEHINSNRMELRTDIREFDCVDLSNIRLAADRAEQVSWRMPDQKYQLT